MAFKDTAKDPLNWLLLILALAFGYYVVAVPYWTNYYLKEVPQEMALEEYLRNPSHPRPFMPHALGTPPSSIEIVVTGLRVAHIDPDAILLESIEPIDAAAAAGEQEPAAPEAPAAEEEAAPEEGQAAPEGEGGAEPGQAPEPPTPAAEEQAEVAAPVVEEAEPPINQILIPGENMDLLELSLGQEVQLQVHDLYDHPLGWVPQNPELGQGTEEMFTKEELDALEFIKIHSNGNTIQIPYVETGELRSASGVHSPGEAFTLEQLANDTQYIRAVNRLAESGSHADLVGVRLVGKGIEERNPYFIVEDGEGRRARVFYNARLLREWYWVRPRLEGQPVVVRGRLRSILPSELRQLEAEANVQAVVDGYAILSEDGTHVFNLESPAEDPLQVSP